MLAYENTLLDLAEREDIIVLTAENRAALRNIPPQLGDRFVDVGIAEQTMIGMAAGFALRGRKPIVHALSTFLTMRAFEHIRTDIGIANLPVLMVGCVPGLLSDGNGPTHQAIEDIAIMRGIPGMEVFCPADEQELCSALPELIRRPNPCYIRYSGAEPLFEHPIPHSPHLIETLTEGDDVAILTHGLLLEQALIARDHLRARGISTRILNVRMPSPIDADTVLTAARECDLVVTLEDHLKHGGLFSIVSELLVERGCPTAVLPIALDNKWFTPGLLNDVIQNEGFNGGAIATKIRARLEKRSEVMANTVRSNEDYPSIAASNALWKRAEGLIPAGTQTLAKGPRVHVDGVAPKYLARGKGCRVWDVDGNEFIDLTMGLGPISLGYSYPAVDNAIRAQLADGITYSLMHPLEVEVAELVRDVVPNAETVRFSKTGADVASAAVRLARAFTGRDQVACCGYHGWHDWYVSTTDLHRGIPAAVRDLTCTFDYNDIDSVRAAVTKDTACVIMEPVRFVAPERGFLEAVREVCDETGALLVFDEMWTGFRIALGGAQEKFGIKSDLALFSKAIANGMPISVLTGRADVMRLFDRDLFWYTTFGGEALSLAATKATITEMRRRDVQRVIAERGARLRGAYNSLCAERGITWTSCGGMDYRTVINFEASAGDILQTKSLMQQELFKRGVLWAGQHVLSLSHGDEEIEYLIDAYGEVLRVVDEHVRAGTVASALRGRAIEAAFKSTRKPPKTIV